MSQIRLNYKPRLYECSCCHQLKPASEFYKQSYTGALNSQCKTCVNVKRSVVRHKDKHGKFVSKEKRRNMEEVDYGLNDWRDAMLHFHGECAYCGRPEGRAKADKFDREHFVPLSRGGRTERSNIGPACRKCNRGRGNKPLFEWFREQPFWSREREQRIVKWIGEEAAKLEGYDKEEII